jgi:hypothetical protein
MDYLSNQQANQRPIVGASTHHHPRTLAWHEGDYTEAFIHISVNKAGAIWTVREAGKQRHRDLVLAPETQSAIERSIECAKRWIRENLPGARIRIRGNLEYGALFNSREEMVRRRKAA